MDVRIFWVCVMEYMGAETRPRFILSSKTVLGEWSQNPCQLQEKNPLHWKNSPQRRIEPTTLHQAGQLAQHTASKLFQPCSGFNPSVYWCTCLILVIYLPESAREHCGKEFIINNLSAWSAWPSSMCSWKPMHPFGKTMQECGEHTWKTEPRFISFFFSFFFFVVVCFSSVEWQVRSYRFGHFL